MSRYQPGKWNAICDICGFQYMSDELFLGTAPGQQGLRVCRKDFDKANPQDFIRPVVETSNPEWTRPDQDSTVESGTLSSSVPVFWINNLAQPIPWTNFMVVDILWSYT